MYRGFFKRFLDILFASVLIVICFPFFMFTALTLLFYNQGSVFFIQSRPGKNEKIFQLMKFKTMNDRKDANGELLSDIDRITIAGKFVRKTSLDELPQLWNVLKGDMSLVGPRPLLVQYLPLYSSEQKRRHLVKPGITGWAQVNGRNAISWDEKFRLDVWYVNHISFLLDLKILFLTVKKVFIREGISANGHVTIEPFKGN